MFVETSVSWVNQAELGHMERVEPGTFPPIRLSHVPGVYQKFSGI